MKVAGVTLEQGKVCVSWNSHATGSGKVYIQIDRGDDREPFAMEISNLEFWNLYEVMSSIVEIVDEYDMHSGKADLPLSPCHREISTDVPF